MTLRATAPLAATAVLALGLAAGGCGSSSSSSSGGAAPTGTTGSATAHGVTISADPNGQLQWVQNRAEAAAGTVRVTLENQSSVPHDLHLTGNGVDQATPVFAGGKKSFTVKLKPGTYDFRCDVPGHQNMTGKLVVH